MNKWQPIETAPSTERVIASGWQPKTRTTAGYWWVHEDATDENGVPLEHPNASHWMPLPNPPESTYEI